MASKIFYEKSRIHRGFYADIHSRVTRALQRGVPPGRGHPWKYEDENKVTRFPNWKEYDWSLAVKEITKPFIHLPRTSPTKVNEERFPVTKLLQKFLHLHPQVAYRVPYQEGQKWAPTIFCEKQLEFMQKNKLSESQAYQKVVQIGGGGGEWNGVWETLEHDRFKRILKKSVQHTRPGPPISLKTQQIYNKNNIRPKKYEGISLIDQYYDAKLQDLQSDTKRNEKTEEFLRAQESKFEKMDQGKNIQNLKLLEKIRMNRYDRSEEETKSS